MNKQSSGIRFESREIAVILSLFIMVSLLMFTVGIVVGKGLAQAKFEGNSSPVASLDLNERAPSSAGTSVSANPPIVHPPSPAETPLKVKESEPQEETAQFNPSEPLELKPKKSGSLSVHENVPVDLNNPETVKLLKNPKLKDLFEDENKPLPEPKKVVAKKEQGSDGMIEGDFTRLQDTREIASAHEKLPPSFAKGPYSVQVAAYSDESQAKERVDALKKLGFSHAYLSAINLGENKETWFRVWLGYYPSFESAKQGGQALQARGEVKNFLVRKSESSRP